MKKNKLLPYLKKDRIEAGCDEAGRGCLAGPVFAAAVILPKNYKNDLLDDSKKLSEKNRYELREMIEKDAIAYSVAMLDNNEIDKINILNASITGMHRAVDALKKKPGYLLIDGNKFKPYKDIPHECIVKGDGKMMSIAAASILAKTYRDDFMIALHDEFPQYNWKKNKGYPTKDHVDAIMKHGHCKYHRKTFHLKSMQLSFEF